MHRGNVTTACSNWVRSTIDEATQVMFERCPGAQKFCLLAGVGQHTSVGSTNGTSLVVNPLWKAIYTMNGRVAHPLIYIIVINKYFD